MSIWIDYFFNSDKSFDRLLKEINEQLGSSLVLSETDENNSHGFFFGMPFDFHTNTLENDGQLNFQDYKFQIGLTTYWGSADLRQMQILTVASIAFLFYRRMQISEGILVYDLQRLLARYEEKITSDKSENLFDKISNKFVELPQHLVDIDKLLWQ